MARPDLYCDDQALLGECDVHITKSSGPGGQHRNKVSSAVRLRHRPTGITANGDDSRSQHDNRRMALRRMRMNLAVQLREPVDRTAPRPPAGWDRHLTPDRGGQRRLIVSATSEDYWPIAAFLLDLLEACEGKLSDAAVLAGLTGSNITKVLQADRHALTAAQDVRKRFGLGTIR